MKPFRLFISSTFSDFVEERNILQKEVFPNIEKYCHEKGRQFQAIDLRWGVNDEAQYDQKTLEICLNEVHACKTHPHPNFLVMLADRYGWVPLPRIIEQDEFEEILLAINNKENHELLNHWYNIDHNQIPTSYILQPRINNSKEFKEWEQIETKLRTTVQDIVIKLEYKNTKRDKYFLSATEQEVIHGVCDYGFKTEQQDGVNGSIDKQYVFGFLRKIDGRTLNNDVHLFRKNLAEILPAENIFTNKSSETSEYLSIFAETLIEKLKKSIDSQAASLNLTPLETEQSEQGDYKNDKLKNFTGRKEELTLVQDYIHNKIKYPKQPLIFYGPSGMGKSALIAKAIEACQENQLKVIYRFAGATVQSSDIKSILSSIFEQLEIDYSALNKGTLLPNTLENFDESNLQNFDQWAIEAKNILSKINNPTIIFIDAIDQLNSQDKLLWIPSILPDDLKIIITVLNDDNYIEDSKHYEKLKKLYNNLFPITPLSIQDGENLLDKILIRHHRQLQTFQKKNIQLNQGIKSPLYLNIISQELRNIHSDDAIDIAGNQQGAIKEYINNLYTYYSHHQELIKRVFGYIYASDIGISEGELLKLLAIEKDFLDSVASEKYHKRPVNGQEKLEPKLPDSVWARLYYQIKPFLREKTAGHYTLLTFFHREFSDAIKEQGWAEAMHTKLLINLEAFLEKNNDQPFDQNRWGKIHALTLTSFTFQYNKKNNRANEFIVANKNCTWFTGYLNFIGNNGEHFFSYNKNLSAISCFESIDYIYSSLYYKNQDKWVEEYTKNITSLASSYSRQNKFLKAISSQEKAVKIIEVSYRKNSEYWEFSYINSLHKLLLYTNYNNKYKKGKPLGINYSDIKKDTGMKLHQTNEIEIFDKVAPLVRKAYKNNNAKFGKIYSEHLHLISTLNLEINRSLINEKESLLILEHFYRNNYYIYDSYYFDRLTDLANVYMRESKLEHAMNLAEKSSEYLREIYSNNTDKYIEQYCKNLNTRANIYEKQSSYNDAINLCTEILTTVDPLYRANPGMWEYTIVSAYNKLSSLYEKSNQKAKAIEVKEYLLKILDNLRKISPLTWTEGYIKNLRDIDTLKNQDSLDSIFAREEKIIDIRITDYSNNPELWEKYIQEFNNLISEYEKYNKVNQAEWLQKKLLATIKGLYKVAPHTETEWIIENYVITLIKISLNYAKYNQLDQAISLQKEALLIIKDLIFISPYEIPLWADNFHAVILINLSESYAQQNGKLIDALELQEQALDITESLYNHALLLFGDKEYQDMLFTDQYAMDGISEKEFFEMIRFDLERQSTYYLENLEVLLVSYKALGRTDDTLQIETKIKTINHGVLCINKVEP